MISAGLTRFRPGVVVVVGALGQDHDLVIQVALAQPPAEDGLGVPVLASGVHDVAAEFTEGIEEIEGDVERRVLVHGRAEDEPGQVTTQRCEAPVFHHHVVTPGGPRRCGRAGQSGAGRRP